MKNFIWYGLRQISRDGAGDGAGAGGGTGGAGGSGTGEGAGETKTFTQDELNAILAKERRAAQDRLTQQIVALDAIKRDGLTPEAKQQLEQQIESLRTQTATAEELAKQTLAKKQKEWEKEKEILVKERDQFRKSLDDLQVQNLIDTAMSVNQVRPGATAVVSAYVRQKLERVPELDAQGKPTGRERYVVTLDVTDAETKQKKQIHLDPVAAVAQLRDQEDFANLFVTQARSGIGGTGQSGGAVDIRQMSQAEYMALRKTNPGALGLKPSR